jgi:mRNA interferase RelE/StbE
LKVVLERRAAKYLDTMPQSAKARLKAALEKLEKEPPEGDISNLVGKDGYRLRIGGHRILFDRIDDHIIVYKIGPRGQAYKGGGTR